MSKDYVILSGVRTPFGKFGGNLKDVHVINLGAMVMKEAIKRANLKPKQINEVSWGCGDTSKTEDLFTSVVGRQSLLEAGLHPDTPCCIFGKSCISGTSVLHYGVRTLKAGDADIVLVGGATHFSSIPFLLSNMHWNEIAAEYGISSEEQDEFVRYNRERYARALERGSFKNEIMPIKIKQKDGLLKVMDIDEQYMPKALLNATAQLDSNFNMSGMKSETALGLYDGAVALILTTREKADALAIKPLATIVDTVSTGADSRKLPIAPAAAIGKAFEKTGLTIDDMDIIEINEAFSCIPLISAKILAGGDEAQYQEIKSKLNVNGSTISTGHTNYSSGAGIVLTMCYELKRRGGGIGVMGICGGLTQGDAAIIRVEP